MIDLATFTTLHTALSLLALATGLLALIGLFDARIPAFWTPLFLAFAVATSATGFGFPFHGLLPSHIVGIVALLVLAIVILARYVFRLAGAWRWIYAVGIVVSEYFLAFVGIAQAFLKIPVIRNLAPTSTEPPFAVAQLAALALFVALGIMAARATRRSRMSAMHA
jgi:hypothetical protein